MSAVSLFESSLPQLSLNENFDRLECPTQTTIRAVDLVYCLWLPFSINRVLNSTKLSYYATCNF